MSVDQAAWLDDLEASFQEVAGSALGLDGLRVISRYEEAPALEGAYLSLAGPSGALQIGLASSTEGCLALARSLMGLGETDALDEAEVADAVCEIVNIVAGVLKGRLRDRATSLQMGLPVFIRGAVQATERVAVRMSDVRAGPIPAALLLIHPRSE